MAFSLDSLRRSVVAESLFLPTTLRRALERMQFVQADPIRAPARAQDLILRHRVKDYRSGDLERRYARLGVEEDFFINYGFVTRKLQALMHPRSDAGAPAAGCLPWPAARRKRALLLLEFVREHGGVHPREVDDYFAHGKVKNYWGETRTQPHICWMRCTIRDWLRVLRRESGIRIYAAHEHEAVTLDEKACEARLDALADAAVRIYAPLPIGSLRFLLRRLRFATPQWATKVTGVIERAKNRLAHAPLDGADWYWPAEWKMRSGDPDEKVRLLAPFDPVVWDRWRFQMLWGWRYRFEAYTPVAKRVRGYYAMPMLWRDRVIGWGNLSASDGSLKTEIGYVGSAPRDILFKRKLEEELERMREFLGLDASKNANRSSSERSS
jgi:hypothetical protein